MKLAINDTNHDKAAECNVLFIVMLDVVLLSASMLNALMLNAIMLNAIMLNVIMLNVIMLNVIMLNVIMLNVVMWWSDFSPKRLFTEAAFHQTSFLPKRRLFIFGTVHRMYYNIIGHIQSIPKLGSDLL